METIWKYKLQITDEQEVEMPAFADILTVQKGQDEDDIFLYAIVNPEAEKETREILIFGTGNPLPSDVHFDVNCVYIGTVQTHNHNLVWHVFEKI